MLIRFESKSMSDAASPLQTDPSSSTAFPNRRHRFFSSILGRLCCFSYRRSSSAMAPIEIRDPPSSFAQPSPPPIQRPGESKTQAMNRLATELNVAKMAKIHAERKVLELEDVLRQQSQLNDVSSQQCEAAWDSVNELKQQIGAQDTVIKRLREDAKNFPLSSVALNRSHEMLCATIETLRECFTCPLCYEGLAKSDAVSLRCGHTFCQACIEQWAKSALSEEPFQSHTRKFEAGSDAPVQCPECRTAGSVRVRLYMLEEAIRLLSRAETEREMVQAQEAERRAQLEVVSDPKPVDYLGD
ncbi:hypothetical protein O181_038652 [Austropuccinia psidii MF-1]|uniref:RING-type domain-containing protein n=1 Tax=Austropuccinia psidii MF-1 TaxID=1389203 RepID=A0A9Q3DBC1_9BASI|nr:hypothetical protein [Austropuccinia psidii MF-1]